MRSESFRSKVASSANVVANLFTVFSDVGALSIKFVNTCWIWVSVYTSDELALLMSIPVYGVVEGFIVVHVI